MDIIEPEKLLEEAKALYKADQYAQCIRICNIIIKQERVSPDRRAIALHLLGESYLDLDRFEDAQKTYSSLLIVEKTDIAFANRGFSYMGENKWDNALSDYLEAVRLNPKNWPAIKFAAECLIKLGKNGQAIEMILKHIDDETRYGGLYRVLGVAYSKSEQWLDAFKAFRRALSLDSDDSYSRTAMKEIEKMAED